MQKPRRPFPFLAVGFGIYAALFFSALAMEETYWDSRFVAGPLGNASALVARLWKSSGPGGTDYYIHYAFTDQSGVRHERSTDLARDVWNAERVGTTVQVIYLLDKPTRNRLVIESPSAREEKWWLFAGLALVFAVFLSFRVDAGYYKRIPLTWHEPGKVPDQHTQLFRACLREHWPFSMLLFALGGAIAWISIGMNPRGFDDDVMGRIFFFPAGLLLMSLPAIFHFRFYVRVGPDFLEVRNFGSPKRIAWRDLRCAWRAKTPQVEFASLSDAVAINFKLFSRDCTKTVHSYALAYFKKSI